MFSLSQCNSCHCGYSLMNILGSFKYSGSFDVYGMKPGWIDKELHYLFQNHNLHNLSQFTEHTQCSTKVMNALTCASLADNMNFK